MKRGMFALLGLLVSEASLCLAQAPPFTPYYREDASSPAGPTTTATTDWNP